MYNYRIVCTFSENAYRFAFAVLRFSYESLFVRLSDKFRFSDESPFGRLSDKFRQLRNNPGIKTPLRILSISSEQILRFTVFCFFPRCFSETLLYPLPFFIDTLRTTRFPPYCFVSIFAYENPGILYSCMI